MFSPKPTTSSYQDTIIKNDGFWPNLNVGDFEKNRNIPTDLDSGTVSSGLVASVTQVNKELSSVKKRLLESEVASAENAVGYPSIGDKNGLVILYENAVFSLTKSMLISEYASLTTKDAGERLSENGRSVKDELQAEYQQSIRAISGKGRVGVSLL